MAAAARRIGRLKRIDRAAVVIITLGGIAVVVCVLGILLFIAAEAVPLLPAAATCSARWNRRLADAQRRREAPALGGAGVDEYQRYLYGVESRGAGRLP